MLQSSFSDCVALGPFSLQEDSLAAPEVDVGGCEVAEALVIAVVIVVLDEAPDVGFEIARQVVVFEQNAVLQGLMPALDLALGLGMMRHTANVIHAFVVEPFGEIGGDVAGTVITQQARFANDAGLVAA